MTRSISWKKIARREGRNAANGRQGKTRRAQHTAVAQQKNLRSSRRISWDYLTTSEFRSYVGWSAAVTTSRKGGSDDPLTPLPASPLPSTPSIPPCRSLLHSFTASVGVIGHPIGRYGSFWRCRVATPHAPRCLILPALFPTRA